MAFLSYISSINPKDCQGSRYSLIQAFYKSLTSFVTARLLNSMPGDCAHLPDGLELERLANIIPSPSHQGMEQPCYIIPFIAESDEKQSPNVYTGVGICILYCYQVNNCTVCQRRGCLRNVSSVGNSC